jgi:hypothetical protein
MAQVVVGVKANQVSSKNTLDHIYTLWKNAEHLQQMQAFKNPSLA